MAVTRTLFDLPEWYKETPGARASRVSGTPFQARAVPQIPVPEALSNLQLPKAPVAPTLPAYTGKSPDASLLNPILERLKTEQTKIDPLAKVLSELKAEIDTHTVAREAAIKASMDYATSKGIPPSRRQTLDAMEKPVGPYTFNVFGQAPYEAYQKAKAGYTKAANDYKTNYAAYTEAIAPLNSARQEYEAAFAPYKADLDAYNAQITPLKEQYSKDYAAYRSSYDANKTAYDLIQKEQSQAKNSTQDEIAATSLRRATPVTDEVPVEQLIAGPMESTAQRQANLGLYSDDLATMMQARKGR